MNFVLCRDLIPEWTGLDFIECQTAIEQGKAHCTVSFSTCMLIYLFIYVAICYVFVGGVGIVEMEMQAAI